MRLVGLWRGLGVEDKMWIDITDTNRELKWVNLAQVTMIKFYTIDRVQFAHIQLSSKDSLSTCYPRDIERLQDWMRSNGFG